MVTRFKFKFKKMIMKFCIKESAVPVGIIQAFPPFGRNYKDVATPLLQQLLLEAQR